MIQLKADCLIFKTNDGEQIPCSAEWVTLELMGDSALLVDPELVRNASAAVLHYFKHELQRQYVSVGEFAQALEKVLRGFGWNVYSEHTPPPPELEEPKSILEYNLRQLAGNAACESFELAFFPQLRIELKRQLEKSPNILRFHGLRDCVKTLSGSSRWNRRCQTLHDQIVEFLRNSLQQETSAQSCALLVL